MFASFGKAVESTSITFLSKASYEAGIHDDLSLKKIVKTVSNVRNLTKKDMKLNGETPVIEVDPQTYEVTVDGDLITCEPAEILPMAQRYFLF
jgi:urease subunit alpha